MSRLRMLARAEAITGRDLGYLKTFEAISFLQNRRYSEHRARYREAHPDLTRDELTERGA